MFNSPPHEHRVDLADSEELGMFSVFDCFGPKKCLCHTQKSPRLSRILVVVSLFLPSAREEERRRGRARLKIEGGSVSLHNLGEYHFLQVDKRWPGPNAGPVEINRGFEDQVATFHYQDPVGERHRFFDVVGD
jgi:hypothetical protein